MKAFYNTDEILLSVTQDELATLRDACFHAFTHWSKLAESEQAEGMKYTDREVAKKYATSHDELARIIKSLPF